MMNDNIYQIRTEPCSEHTKNQVLSEDSSNPCSECSEIRLKFPKFSFARPCKRQHSVIWAKFKGYGYRPAKAMNVHDGGLVEVCFFGDHSSCIVPIKDCYFYSKEYPGDSKSCNAEEYDLALKVSYYY